MGDFIPKVGQWLYATCAGDYYGEIIGVGVDGNNVPTIDIRVRDPNDIIWVEDEIELNEGPQEGKFWNALTYLELPEGVLPILRQVQWRHRGKSGKLFRNDKEYDVIECNTPGDGCYRCVKCFWVHEERER